MNLAIAWTDEAQETFDHTVNKLKANGAKHLLIIL